MLLITGAATPNCLLSSVDLRAACVAFQLARRDSKGCEDCTAAGPLASEVVIGAEESVRSVSGRPGADGAEGCDFVVVGCELGGAMRSDWTSLVE